MTYDRNSMFHLSEDQWAKHDAWVEETRQIRLRQQREDIAQLHAEGTAAEIEQAQFLEMVDRMDIVYDGAIGGAYEYTFIPTSVGTFVKVSECVTGRELKLDNLG